MKNKEKQIELIQYFAAVHITPDDIRSIRKEIFSSVFSALSDQDQENKDTRTLYVLFTALALLHYHWSVDILIEQVKSGSMIDALCESIMLLEDTSTLNQFIAEFVRPEHSTHTIDSQIH